MRSIVEYSGMAAIGCIVLEVAEFTEAISHRESQRAELLSGGGRRPFGRHMDREAPRSPAPLAAGGAGDRGVSRSIPREARPTASLTFVFKCAVRVCLCSLWTLCEIA